MKKLESLQALRGIAFLGIFFIHSKFAVNWAGISVSVFFVLAGFLCERQYSGTFDRTDIKRSLFFAWNRIRKIYPLHIILMLLWAAKKLADNHSLRTVVVKTAEVLLHVTLTQSWIPYSTVNVCLNGVAWFLSTVTAHYFIFPFVSNRLRQEKTMKKPVLLLIVMLLLQVMSCWLIKTALSVPKEVYSWFMYTFPVFRFVDFYAGMCLWHLVSKTHPDNKIHPDNRTAAAWTVLEAAAVLLMFLLYRSLEWPRLGKLHEAIYNGTTIYIMPAMLWVWLFFQKKGIITHLLSLKPFVCLGGLSPYLFLIHFPVTQFDGWLLKLTDNIFIIAGTELLLSVLLAMAYIKAEQHFLHAGKINGGKD